MAGQEIAPRADKDLSQEQLMKQLEQARVELGRTVDAIADKVKPANIAKRTMDQVRQRVATVDPKLAGAGGRGRGGPGHALRAAAPSSALSPPGGPLSPQTTMGRSPARGPGPSSFGN